MDFDNIEDGRLEHSMENIQPYKYLVVLELVDLKKKIFLKNLNS